MMLQVVPHASDNLQSSCTKFVNSTYQICRHSSFIKDEISFSGYKIINYKNTKSKTGFWGLTPFTDLVFENNLDADIFWNLNPHKLSECALICVKVD